MPRALDGRLSAGQLAALRLAASGYTSRQIAGRLGTTEGGIHIRLKTAADSLGARSRTHAVVIALARGLLRVEELEVPGRPVGCQEPADGPQSAPEAVRVARDVRGADRAAQGRTGAAA
jgi:DNA-binding CsgD family transcriptional regulator